MSSMVRMARRDRRLERDRAAAVPEFGRDRRNAFQALRRSIGADRLGIGSNRSEVGADLRLGHDQAGRRFLVDLDGCRHD